MQERPPPEITVRDPSRPADVLVSGEDEPRSNPFTKRRLQALGAVVLVVAAALGVAEVRERQAAAAEERRLNRVLDLAVDISGSSSSYDQRRGGAELELQLDLGNDGPRDVVVERAAVGGYLLAQSLVQVPAGEQRPLLLRRTVTCSRTTPPPVLPVDALRLELRTAAGPRAVDLPLEKGAFRDEAARACGFVPLEEALDVQLLGGTHRARSFELFLDISSRSIVPVALTGLDLGPGMRGRITVTDGVSAVLPLSLPPHRRDGIRSGIYLEVQATVVDCADARTTAPQLELQVTDKAGRRAATTIDYDPAFLGSLLSTACPT